MTIDLSPATRTDRGQRRKVVLVGGIVPIAIAAIATVAMLVALPELPNPIATHWSAAGPDGFGPALPMIFLPLGIAVLYSLFAIGSALGNSAEEGLAWTQKFLLVTGCWLSALISIGIGGSVVAQRGLADAAAAPGPGLLLIVGAGVGLALAIAGWLLLPKTDRSREAGVVPEPLSLSGTERITWSRTVLIGRAVLVLIGVVFVLSLGISIATMIVGDTGSWLALACLAIVVVLAAMTSYWRVTASQQGLTVCSLAGWPRIRIPIEDISAVQVVEVNPTADFGGWGYRWAGGGRIGVIMRAGSAIEVTRKNGKRFVVTVSDAMTGAGVIAAQLANRRRANGD